MSIDQILVVPCYNEAQRFRAESFAKALEAIPSLGLLFVNDGSRDSTEEVLEQFVAQHRSRCCLLQMDENKGKAEAVRQGFLAAFAGQAFFEKTPWSADNLRYIGYWDCDLATPLTEYPSFRQVFDTHPHLSLVMGARVNLLGRSISRHAHRHYLGRIFATAASSVLRLPVYDTQCGAKVFPFHPRTAALFAKPFLSTWIFDVELLARMKQELASRNTAAVECIYELPLREWKDIDGSKVKPKDFIKAIFSLLRIARTYPQVKLIRKEELHVDLT